MEARILQSPASVVPRAKLALLNRAVLAACDAIDGVMDGLLTDPHQCQFDPATLLCRGADRDDCLTAQQLEAVKVGYAPARRKTGELIHPGLVPGGETGWAMLTAANPEPGSIDVGMFRFVAHEDPVWDWRTFDLDRDTSLIDKKADFIDAVNPDRSFGLVVGNFSSTTARTTAARVGRSRRRTASTITRACWQGWGRNKRTG